MKKTAKKIIAIFTLLTLLLSLAACGGSSFKCDVCGKEKTGQSYKSQLLGAEVTVCEDCYKDMKNLFGY